MTRKVPSRRGLQRRPRPRRDPEIPAPAASSVAVPAGSPIAAALHGNAAPKPGLLARWLTRIILSRWVIARIGNPGILALLLTVARGSGHPHAIAILSQRLESGSATLPVSPSQPAPPTAALPPRQLAALRDQAVELCGRSDRTGIAAAIGQLLTRAPEDPVLLRCLGLALAAEGAHEAAVSAFRQGLAVRPDDAVTLHNLGKSLRALGALDEAAAAHRRALALRPKYAEAHNSLGVVFQAQDNSSVCKRARRPVRPGCRCPGRRWWISWIPSPTSPTPRRWWPILIW